MTVVPENEGKVPPRRVPFSALALSVLALGIPVGMAVAFPDLASEDVGLLVWLTALVPPFLLTYHRSWRGASLALAGGMVALTVSQVVLAFSGVEPPPVSFFLWVVSVLIAVSLGAGWLSDLLHRARLEAEAMALTDPLTGLPNRRHLTLFLESNFAAARRGTPLSLVLFDLDHFKEVNDRDGHREGDGALRRFGEILATRTRAMNVTGRWGGEEFLSVLNGTGGEGARIFADRVRRLLAEERFDFGTLTVSAGVATFVPGMQTPEILLAAADQALYRAKEAGRNQVASAPTSLPRLSTDQREERAPPEEPDAAGGSEAKAPDRDPMPRGSGEVILVVDDDRDARGSVSRALARAGYHVLQASGPDEATEIVRGRDEPVDLLVTDVIMPSMSGFRLVEMLQQTRPTLRVVYMSGYDQGDMDWSGAPGAASAFLAKPMSLEELARAVRRVLDHPAAPSGSAPPHGTAGSAVGGEDAASTAAPGSPATDGASGTPAPAGTAPWGERAPDLPETPELRRSRILVVDDDEDVVRSLVFLLRRCGFPDVRGTTDPADLPVLLAQYEPDLVLLDMHMPDMGGLEVLEAIRPFLLEGTFLPVVALTGDSDPELRRQALANGAADFIQKPVEAWEMETRVRNLLRIRAMTRRAAGQAQELESRVAARTAELEEARTEVLIRLARAAEYRDDETGHHAERVGALAGALAERLGMDPADRDVLERAAPLHDVGKIGIPDHILRKPGPLSRQEMELMRTHTTIGAEILEGSRVRLLRAAREIALHHHERWDGTGYPHGLRGEAIPLPARIVAVADVFDSLSHDRPYRKALSSESTLGHLTDCRGSLYDPQIIDALVDLHRSGRMAGVEAVQLLGRPSDSATGAAGTAPVRPAADHDGRG